MGAAYFYHLTSSPLEATLPALLQKARAAGWRILVRATSDDMVSWLDQKLWLHGEASFLPHGASGGAHDAQQPILLTASDMDAGDRDCLFAVEGAAVSAVSASEVGQAERVCILFDGNDLAAVAQARKQWKLVTEARCSAQYWAQESGRWINKTTSQREPVPSQPD